LAELTAAVQAITNGVLPSMPALSPPPAMLSPMMQTPPPPPPPPSKKDKKQSATSLSKQHRDYNQTNNLDEFAVHASLVKKLFEDRSGGGKNLRRDVAYLQVSLPGKTFETYDREKYRLPITVNAYFEVLKFFKQEYRMVENRMEADYKTMMERKNWLSLCPSISFRGGADIEFKLPVDVSNSFTLNLVVRKVYETGKKCIFLEYSDASMGKIPLPATGMAELAKDHSFLSGLCNGDYKESMINKRSRQY